MKCLSVCVYLYSEALLGGMYTLKIKVQKMSKFNSFNSFISTPRGKLISTQDLNKVYVIKKYNHLQALLAEVLISGAVFSDFATGD